MNNSGAGRSVKTYNIILLQVLPVDWNDGALDDEIILELLAIFVFLLVLPWYLALDFIELLSS